MRHTLCLFLLCISVSLRAQQPTADNTYKLFFEKVYLHTDRERYSDGDDIWFKAYLVNAQSHYLFDASNNLYVELISPDAKIVDRKVIRIESGKGNGDLHLNDSIAPGSYRLRAYTNWMRNFGDNFVFEKELIVFSNPAHKKINLITDSRYKGINRRYAKKNPEGTAFIDTAYHVYFFPEGGYMVENVSGRIGFKAVAPSGKGVSVKGKIYDSTGKEVSSFSCDSTGLGIFELLPYNQQHYSARGLYEGEVELSGTLPVALARGLSLRVDGLENGIEATINTNAETLQSIGGTRGSVAARCNGKLVYTAEVAFTSLHVKILIPRSQLPGGLLAITAYDEAGKPHCERLYYNEPKEKSRLDIHSDQPIYPSKGKSTISIKTTGIDGQPVSANLSLAVVNAALIPVNRTSIVSYLALQSEIRGSIENSQRYFDEANPLRKQQLDVLLMTQGWRNFVWRRLQDSALRISYMIEKGMTISGRVRRIWVNKPIEKTNITLQAFKAKGNRLFGTVTDTAGKFYFDNVNLYGKQLVRMYSMKNANRGSGELEDFPVFENPLKVNFIDRRLDESQLFNPSDSAMKIQQEAFKKWKLSDTITLKEIRVSSGRTNFSTKIAPPPQHFLVNDKFKKNYKTLFHFLLAECADCQINDVGGLKASFIFRGNTTRSSSIGDIYYMGMEKVDKIDIEHYYTPLGLMSNITVYVRADAFENNLNVKYFYVDGYYQARTFYTPKYEAPSTTTDLRTTIHWEPNITTNEKGEATITYYNADPKTKVRIVAEGITAGGVPVAATTLYEIK